MNILVSMAERQGFFFKTQPLFLPNYFLKMKFFFYKNVMYINMMNLLLFFFEFIMLNELMLVFKVAQL